MVCLLREYRLPHLKKHGKVSSEEGKIEIMNLSHEFKLLNEAQRFVVENLNDNLLVMAPAGTGKTNVITWRTAHFIESGVLPKKILCLTFTNKACEELKQRLIKTVGKVGQEVVVKTFHGLCYQLIKEEGKQLGKISTNCLIIDEEDAKFLMKELIADDSVIVEKVYQYIQDFKLFQLLVSFPKTQDDTILWQRFNESEKAQRFYFSLKNSDSGSYTLAYLSQLGLSLYRQYQRHLQENHLVDFNDLILYAHELLQQKEILERWNQRFEVVVVDEVQDTSLAEYQLIQKLAKGHSFSAYGDFNQTIYEWRDSNPVLIRQRILDDFNPICLELSLNYRSTKRLVEMSANYLENAKRHRLLNESLSPKWIEAASEDLGYRPVYFEAQTKEEEMRFIIDHLKTQRLNELAKTVVLTRSNNQNKQVSQFLRSEGIPCYLVDQLTLFKRKGIKDLLAIIKFQLNPFDEVSLERLLPLVYPDLECDSMVSLKYKKRYEQYDMRLVDLFNPTSYSLGDPYGMLLNQLKSGRVVICDVESTGLDVTRDEVIQIAAIELVNGKQTRSFEKFIIPTNPVGDSVVVHNFTDEYLRQVGETPESVFESFLQFIKGAALVGHNIQYDIKIVSSQLRRLGMTWDCFAGYYDTLDIVRRLYPDLKNHKLDTVSDFIGVSHEPTHNAMDDILATKEVLLKSINRLEKYQVNRMNVTSYYENKLKNVMEAQQHIKNQIEVLLPHQFLNLMIDELDIWNRSPWSEDEVEQESLRECLISLEQMTHRELQACPSLSMWELWTRILHHISLSNSELDRAMKDQNQLAIITVHQAKGLEFDHVILPFLNQGMFPLDFDGINVEEECRLFYVALTRAKKTLLLTRHQKEYSYSKKVKERSRFIDFLYQN